MMIGCSDHRTKHNTNIHKECFICKENGIKTNYTNCV